MIHGPAALIVFQPARIFFDDNSSYTGATNIAEIMNTIKILKKVYPLLLGAGIGFAYYYFIGCTTGSCPIQSNPYISTAYGALVGAAFLIPGKKKKKDTN